MRWERKRSRYTILCKTQAVTVSVGRLPPPRRPRHGRARSEAHLLPRQGSSIGYSAVEVSLQAQVSGWKWSQASMGFGFVPGHGDALAAPAVTAWALFTRVRLCSLPPFDSRIHIIPLRPIAAPHTGPCWPVRRIRMSSRTTPTCAPLHLSTWMHPPVEQCGCSWMCQG